MRTTRAIAAMSGGLSVLIIETGVEAMVRDACQLEGRGRPGSGLGHPLGFGAKAEVGDFELPLWPGSSLSASMATLCTSEPPDSCAETLLNPTRGQQRMPTDNVVRIIFSKTPDSAAMLANVKRAMAITARLNRLTFDDAGEIRALFSQLIGKEVDDSFLFIPPFFTRRRRRNPCRA